MLAVVIASGFKLNFGTQGYALGGLNHVLADDYSAVYWNPALLADVRNSAGLDMLTIAPLVHYRMNTGIEGYDGEFPRLKENTAYNYSSFFLIPSFGLVRYGESFTWGLAVFAPFGMGTRWDLYDVPQNYYNTADTTWERPQYPKYDWQSDVRSLAVWFGFGREWGPFRVGLAGGPVGLTVMIRKVNLLDPASIDPASIGLPIEYRLWPIDTKLKGYGLTLGGSAGVMWKVGEMLTLGLTGRYYLPMTLHGNVKLQLFTPRNDYIVENVPDLSMLFSGYIFQGSGEGVGRFSLPPDIGFGVAFHPVRRFTLTAGLTYTFWRVLDKVVLEFEDLTLLYSQIKADTLNFYWKDVLEVGVGGRLNLTDWLGFNFGFSYDQSPVPDSTFTPLMPDVGNRMSFSSGISWTIGDYWTYNLAYYYTMAPDREISSEGFSPDAHFMPGRYSFKAHIVSTGITYRW